MKATAKKANFLYKNDPPKDAGVQTDRVPYLPVETLEELKSLMEIEQ